MYFINVIIPLPIANHYTYQVNEEQFHFIQAGMRVVVPFGKQKKYTAIVIEKHQTPPKYPTKEINFIVDTSPIITPTQIVFFQWISQYYLCKAGQVIKTALPSLFFLESSSIIERNTIENAVQTLSDDAFLIYEALETTSSILLKEIEKIIPPKKVMQTIEELLQADAIRIMETIYEKYKPKMVKYICISPAYEKPSDISALMENIKSEKQKNLLLHYFVKSQTEKSITPQKLLENTPYSKAVLSGLISKGIFQEIEEQKDRVSFQGNSNEFATLTPVQKKAMQEIKNGFENKKSVLLHGVAGSGKTEIYIQLIKEELEKGGQVLLMVPEIALSVQLIERLKNNFGQKMSVYHTKYSLMERVEVWKNVLHHQEKAQLIVAVRGGLFLPFAALSLVIIDEEHDHSYKQSQQAPRMQARDAAAVLARLHQSKLLLASATPSAESMQNALEKKYNIVTLGQRYMPAAEPKVELIDIKLLQKKKRMTGHFSDVLISAIEQTLEKKQQVILLQNRRGYATFLQCNSCGYIMECMNCDVSLTYHQSQNILKCHYCGHTSSQLLTCPACGEAHLQQKGYGTEQIEEQAVRLFPKANIGRLDQDTIKGKFALEKILHDFQEQRTHILIGTQMISKGFDFKNVHLVGIINADLFLYQPDFRAFERTFQLISGVSGRAGRNQEQGAVMIQTYQPQHPIFQQIMHGNYPEMIHQELSQRKEYHYPPFYKLIRITFKYKNVNTLSQAAEWFAQGIKQQMPQVQALGPEFPAIARIKNEYYKQILLKIPPNISLKAIKNYLAKSEQIMSNVAQFKGVMVEFNVDV